MEMDVVADIRAPDYATLDLYCDRVASAVGRLSVRVFGMAGGGRHRARPSPRPRAAAHQHPARSRRGRGDWASLSAAEALRAAGIAANEPAGGAVAARRSARSARMLAERARGHFAEADAIMARSPRRAVRAPRIMAEAYRLILDRLCGARLVGAAPADPRPERGCCGSSCATPSSDARTVHVIGAGLAGLAAAVRLAEAWRARHRARGGRPGRRPLPLLPRSRARHGDRQRQPPAAVRQSRGAGLSGDDRRGGRARRARPAPILPSSICASGERWTLRLNAGRLPWWIFDRHRPRAGHHARATIWRSRGCCGRPPSRPSARSSIATGPLYERLARPLLRRGAQHRAARRAAPRSPAAIIRETLAARRQGLPAADCARRARPRLRRAGAALSRRARASSAVRPSACAPCDFADDRVAALDFGDEQGRAGGGRCGDPRRAAGGGDRTRARARRADRIPRHRQRAFPHRPARRRSRRSSGSSTAPSNGCSRFRAACRSRSAPPTGCWTCRARSSAKTLWQEVAHCSRHSRARCRRGRSCASGAPLSRRRRRRMPGGPAPRPLAQSVSRRRLDRDGTAGDHRRRDPLRQPGRRSRAAAMLTHGREMSSVSPTAHHRCRRGRARLGASIEPATRGAARPAAAGRALGVRARSRRHHPGRIRAAAPLSRRAGRHRARSQDRASICAASRASMAAGRCSTTATST